MDCLPVLPPRLPLKMELRLLSQKESLIATVAYADIFGYPLTRQELQKWSLFYPISRIVVPKTLEDRGGFVTLRGRKRIVVDRLAKAVWQEEKWRIAKRASTWIGYIPTIKLVGTTGGLAMNNAAHTDDIDLFCIVSAGTLWMSRFFATLLMDILGLRRHPKDTRVANKVCLNMFMTDDGLNLPRAERDCFAAHEVLQMQPLWEKRGTYKKFLQANAWVRTFLPNAWKEKTHHRELTVQHEHTSLAVWIVRVLEWPSKRMQLWYMRHHRTHEVITDTILRFHPRDARLWIKSKLAVRLKKYNIPLDKVFWAN